MTNSSTDDPLTSRQHTMCDHMNRILEVLALAAPYSIPRHNVILDRHGHTEQLMSLGLIEHDPGRLGCVRVPEAVTPRLLETMGPIARRYAARAASRALEELPDVDLDVRTKIDELTTLGWG